MELATMSKPTDRETYNAVAAFIARKLEAVARQPDAAAEQRIAEASALIRAWPRWNEADRAKAAELAALDHPP
jgi:hypothetical protein